MTNIVLGFGSTETARENQIHDKICDVVKALVGDNYETIDEKTQDQIQHVVKAFQNASKEEYDRDDKKTPRPERYGYFYATCTFSLSDVVVIMRWSHINSQHPLSPDGMAMMQQTRFVHISSYPQ